MVHYIYKIHLIDLFMKLLWTNSSRNALKKIKEQMIEQHKNNDKSIFRLKFTKKKEFTAIPSPWFTCPAFQLYVNDKLDKVYAVYVFRKNKWVTV